MNEEIQLSIEPLIGKSCCRTQAGKTGGLSLGFGKKIFHGNKRLICDFYGEWEIGSYYGSWRYMQNGKILCASQDVVDDVHELNRKIDEIKLGDLSSIRQMGEFDVRLHFSTGILVEFLATVSDEDELFHIFCPQKVYIELSAKGGWKIGKSDLPWS